MSEWSNIGDVNPIPHGGFWVRKVGDREFEYVRLQLDEDKRLFTIDSGIVCLTDSWIDWKSVNSFADSNDKTPDEHKVNNLVDYYGSANFGGERPDYLFSAENVGTEIEEALRESWGIIL